MRDGQYVDSGDFSNMTMGEIISKMVGREIKEKFPRVSTKRGKKIFEVRNLNAGRMVRDVSFDLHEGEIVGIAGLMGAGRTETTRAIFGVDAKTSGEIKIDGRLIDIKRPVDAIKAGLVLAPEDRKKDGLCTKLSIRENIALPNLDWICSPIGVVKTGAEKEIVEKSRESLMIKMADPENDADSLSGGNQQKVVVGKWIVRNSRVVMFDEPTRGIDVAAKVEIYNLMNRLKQDGIGVLFVSSEMPEIVGISDRVLVMCDGRLTGELSAEEATQNLILEYATKFSEKTPEAV
jgi:ribose transport system ATP-binding protein